MGAAPFTFLPFYPFTFLPLYFSVKDYGESSLVMFMYKMLMNCGFAFIKSANLRTKMFQNAKKIEKNPPPSPSENGCLGCIIEGRTAITTPPKPL